MDGVLASPLLPVAWMMALSANAMASSEADLLLFDFTRTFFEDRDLEVETPFSADLGIVICMRFKCAWTQV
jgi:hypothetical protein